MANSNIKITPQQARDSARKIDSYEGEVHAIVGKLHTLITGELAASWEGQAQVAFSEQFVAFENGPIKKFEELLLDIAKQLTSVAKAFEDNDQNVAAQIKSK